LICLTLGCALAGSDEFEAAVIRSQREQGLVAAGARPPPDPPLHPGAHAARRGGCLGAAAVLSSNPHVGWAKLAPAQAGAKRAHRIGSLGLLWWARCVPRFNPL